MELKTLAWSLTGALVLLGCSAESTEGPLGSTGLGIEGGEEAPDATNVAFVLDQSTSTACTGALIAPNVVLTSRTCVSDTAAAVDCTADIGASHAPGQILVSNAQQAMSATSSWAVQTIVVPPDASYCGDDFALLILSDVVEASDATPVPPRIESPVTAAETFTAYGYGATGPNQSDSGTRRMRDGLSVVCAGDCTNAATNEWTANEGVCPGDGVAVGNDGLLIGVSSRGEGMTCNNVIFEGFHEHADWLKEQVADAATTGGYPVPAWAGGDAGAGGAAGSSGSGGAAGSAGTGGDAGSGGAAGTAGSGSGATGGSAGSAGTPATGGATSDTPPDSGDDDDGGCSCSTQASGSGHVGMVFALLAGILLLRRKR